MSVCESSTQSLDTQTGRVLLLDAVSLTEKESLHPILYGRLSPTLLASNFDFTTHVSSELLLTLDSPQHLSVSILLRP